MRILLIEDHEKVARFIIQGLREEGYAVDYALTGLEGESMATVGEYDLIILDVMLPGKNGFEVTAALRAKQIQSPVLMLTAKAQVEDRVRGLDAGADDYLVKPFAFAELLARVRALLRRGGNSSLSLCLAAGDLRLDSATHRVEWGEERILLTNREYALLEFLVRNKGRVVTRTAIIEHVWDMHFDSDTNLVDVYIRHLRAKLEAPSRPRLIQTVRGVGYMLQAEERG